jgi:pilus assembly protein CpaB
LKIPVQFLLKGKTPFLVALGLGLLAGLLAFSAIRKREADARRGWNLVEVVVAQQDIHEGSTITMDMISSRGVPEQFVTTSVVKPDAISYVLNQRVIVPLQAGDLLLWTQFETLKSERLSSRIQRRTRAITIDVSKKSSVGGWIRPNDHVDVIGAFRDPGTNENVAMTLLQNVLVLATGKITGTTNVNLVPDDQRDYSNVTLLVLPEETEILTLAAELGSLSLALRHEEDVEAPEERGRATVHTLLSGERIKSTQQRRQQMVQVIRGEGSGSGSSGLHDSP